MFYAGQAPSPHIYSKDEYSIDETLDLYTVDATVDFSSEDGLNYDGDTAAKRGITIVSAVSQYPQAQLQKLKQLAKQTVVMHSPNITLEINFMMDCGQNSEEYRPAHRH